MLNNAVALGASGICPSLVTALVKLSEFVRVKKMKSVFPNAVDAVQVSSTVIVAFTPAATAESALSVAKAYTFMFPPVGTSVYLAFSFCVLTNNLVASAVALDVAALTVMVDAVAVLTGVVVPVFITETLTTAVPVPLAGGVYVAVEVEPETLPTPE